MISVDNRQSYFKPVSEWIENHCSTILEQLDLLDYELSVSLVGIEEMTELNEKYLGEQGPTDVLAFPLADEFKTFDKSVKIGSDILGDVVICPEVLEEKKDISPQILELLVHGILHLAGYDHYALKEKEQMFKLQNEILRKLT